MLNIKNIARHNITTEEVEAVCHGKYYPITAYDADPKDVVLYNRLKGGEDNEADND